MNDNLPKFAIGEFLAIVILAVALALSLAGVFDPSVSCADEGVASFTHKVETEADVGNVASGKRTTVLTVDCIVSLGTVVAAEIAVEPEDPDVAEFGQPLTCTATVEIGDTIISGEETTITDFGEQDTASVEIPADTEPGDGDLKVLCEQAGESVVETESKLEIASD